MGGLEPEADPLVLGVRGSGEFGMWVGGRGNADSMVADDICDCFLRFRGLVVVVVVVVVVDDFGDDFAKVRGTIECW